MNDTDFNQIAITLNTTKDLLTTCYQLGLLDEDSFAGMFVTDKGWEYLEWCKVNNVAHDEYEQLCNDR